MRLINDLATFIIEDYTLQLLHKRGMNKTTQSIAG